MSVEGKTPGFLTAVAHGTLVQVHYLLQGGTDPNRMISGMLPLNVAVDYGHADKVDLLLKYGANPNLQCSLGKSAAFCAAAMGNEKILRTVVAAGADVFSTFDCGNLIAVAVLWQDGHKVIPLLVNLGVPIDGFNSDGFTPLMLAATNSGVEEIRTLIDCGATLDLVDRCDGWTALMHAVAHGNRATEAKLLSLGADERIRDHLGRTAAGLRNLGNGGSEPGRG